MKILSLYVTFFLKVRRVCGNLDKYKTLLMNCNKINLKCRTS